MGFEEVLEGMGLKKKVAHMGSSNVTLSSSKYESLRGMRDEEKIREGIKYASSGNDVKLNGIKSFERGNATNKDWLKLGEIYSKSSEPELAAMCYRKGHASKEKFMELAENFVKMEKYAAAAEVFEEVGLDNINDRTSLKKVADNYGEMVLELEKNKNSYRKIENSRAKERINKINAQIEKLEGKGKSLEKRVLGISSLVGFVFSIFFLSSNLTGNIIGNLDSSSANLSGILIFLASLLFGFLALKK